METIDYVAIFCVLLCVVNIGIGVKIISRRNDK